MLAYPQQRLSCLRHRGKLEGIGGRYFEDCSEADVVHRRPDNFGGGVAPYALDPENAERLWSLATTMLAT